MHGPMNIKTENNDKTILTAGNP